MKLLLVTLLSSLATISWGYPAGAGSCMGGEAAVGGTHLKTDDEDNKFRTGPLGEVDIEVAINGMALDPMVPFNAPIDTAHTWSITVTNETQKDFRGFLFRVGGNNVDTSDVFIIDEANTDVQFSFQCGILGVVGGMTHTNPEPKNSVGGELMFEEVAGALDLDVTVVIENRLEDGVRKSAYFYSAYKINAVPALPDLPGGNMTAPGDGMMKPNMTKPMDDMDEDMTEDVVATEKAGRALRGKVLDLINNVD